MSKIERLEAGRDYLPIDWLRHPEASPWKGGAVVRTFLSSGTTAAARSRSRFSEDGLARYRRLSVPFFLAAMGTRAPKKGISLIPTVAEWPDSSLAQMVAWIAEVVPVAYAREQTLELPDEPVWLFGTAFHFLNLIDAGGARTLPTGSLVIETGGTKGKSREVTREDLFREIQSAFGVERSGILSEYGMCELATQAYDAGSGFRFPAHVKLGVMTAPGVLESEGEGLLVVDDPERVDLPWPLRTEDVAQLRGDGSFLLKGRAPGSPLKGCSLLAEEIRDTRLPPLSRNQGQSCVPNFTKTRAVDLEALIASADTLRLLAAEFGSAQAAKSAQDDLVAALPASASEWGEAVKNATGGAGEVPARWLFVLPQNHSIAGLHALAIAHAAGLDVTVRVPKKFEKESLLAAVLKKLGTKTVTSTFRVGGQALPFDALLAFGDDPTIATLRELSGLPVAGFGNRAAAAVLPTSASDEQVAAAVQDALGLGQTGCLSARLIVAYGDGDEAELSDRLLRAGKEFWNAPLPAGAPLGLELEHARYKRLGFSVHWQEDAPLVATRRVDALDSALDFAAARPFVLPLIVVKKSDPMTLVKALIGYETLTIERRFLANSSTARTTFRQLGGAQRARWNGLHEGRALLIAR